MAVRAGLEDAAEDDGKVGLLKHDVAVPPVARDQLAHETLVVRMPGGVLLPRLRVALAGEALIVDRSQEDAGETSRRIGIDQLSWTGRRLRIDRRKRGHLLRSETRQDLVEVGKIVRRVADRAGPLTGMGLERAVERGRDEHVLALENGPDLVIEPLQVRAYDELAFAEALRPRHHGTKQIRTERRLSALELDLDAVAWKRVDKREYVSERLLGSVVAGLCLGDARHLTVAAVQVAAQCRDENEVVERAGHVAPPCDGVKMRHPA